MIDLVDTRIKAFGKSPKDGFVSSSEQLITLTIGQLQELVTRAVEEAIEPLNAKVESMEATITGLKGQLATLESTQATLSDNQLIQLRLIHDLRADKVPGPLMKDRAEILRALIIANGGKMLAKDARHKMRLDKQVFSNLLATAEDIEVRTLKTDRRQRLLVLG